ncbi:MAG: hypothetical protein HY856_13565 [Burkholderiales bacterium]|nr:hypothetical protein [Burkholderiales bacterium]
MALLPVNGASSDWLRVVEYAHARIGELTEECIAINTDAGRRQDIAARIAELRELLKAPEATRLTAELHESQPRGVY